MDQQQMRLVNDGPPNVRPISGRAAQMFYARLFELDPKFREMFDGDSAAQNAPLRQAVAAAVRTLSDLPKLAPVLEHLARRNRGYDAYDHDCATVGRALLWTLGEGVAGAFAADERSAWGTIYGVLSDSIQRGQIERQRPVAQPQTAAFAWSRIGAPLTVMVALLALVVSVGR